MKKTLLLIGGLLSLSFADVHLYTCGVSVDGDEATFDICYSSDEAIAGIQFAFFGGTSGLSLTSISGGAAEEASFTLSLGGTTILGFSFTGSVLDPSEGTLLLSATGTFDSAALTEIGPSMGDPIGTTGSYEYGAFSNTDAVSMPVTTSSSQWDGASTLDGSSILPSVYSLSEAYPNPFNPTTTIDYTLRENSNVSIVIYDLMGRVVKELVNEFQFADGGATHSIVWNGVDNSGNVVSSGIYIYRMVSNDFTKSHRITLMK